MRNIVRQTILAASLFVLICSGAFLYAKRSRFFPIVRIPVQLVCLTASGTVYTYEHQGTVRSSRYTNRRLEGLYTFNAGKLDWRTALFCSSTGKHVLLSTSDQSAMLMAPASPQPQRIPVHDIACACFSSNDHYVAFQQDDNLWLLDIRTTRLTHLSHKAYPYLPSEPRQESNCAFSPDERLLATMSADLQVSVWNTQTCKLIQRFPITSQSPAAIAFISPFLLTFSPDSSLLYTTWGNKDVRIWNLADGHLRKTLPGFAANMSLLVLSPNGSRLAAASNDGKTTVWNLQTDTQAWLQKSNSLWTNPFEDTDWLARVAFSPDSKRLLVARDHQSGIEVWDTESGQKLGSVQPGRSVSSAGFCENGRNLAVYDDKNLLVWDLQQ